MIVKPSTQWLNKSSDADLINTARTILKSTGDNTGIYPAPNPTLAVVQAAVDNFSAGLAAAADGSRSATSAKKQLRRVLVDLLRQLANYIHTACGGSMTNLLLSGFPAQKPLRQPVGSLSAPGNLTVRHGSHSGELTARVKPVPGSSTYNWQLTDCATGAVVQTLQTTGTKGVFSGLTPGVTYSVTVNAVGTAGPSDWSDAASQMAV